MRNYNLAIIPARGGSKGIKNKNLKKINNKTLIQITFDAIIDSKIFNEVVITSDSNEILDHGRKIGAKTIKRPKKYSTDNAPSELAVSHILRAGNYGDISNLGLFQPTSPLRTHNHIKKAFNLFTNNKCKSLISVSSLDSKYLKLFYETEQDLNSISPELPFMPRQKLPRAYLPNGAIYLSKFSHFIKNQSFASNKMGIFKMSIKSSLDIDTPKDLRLAKKILLGSK